MMNGRRVSTRQTTMFKKGIKQSDEELDKPREIIQIKESGRTMHTEAKWNDTRKIHDINGTHMRILKDTRNATPG